MGGAVKGLFGGGKTSASVRNVMPQWFQDTAKWSNESLETALKNQDEAIGNYVPAAEYQPGEYAATANPYGDFQNQYGLRGMLGSEAGQEYWNMYARPAQAGVQNAFAANGLYGSQGQGMMDQALGNALSAAQNNAVNAWNNDLLGRARQQEWENENALNKLQYETGQNQYAYEQALAQQQYQDALRQNYIQNLLSLYGIVIPQYNQANTVTQKTSSGASGLGSLLSGVGSVAGAFFSSPEYKRRVRSAPDVLESVRRLDVPTWEYKAEFRGLMDPEGGRHIGPMADQWAEKFGGDGRQIPAQEAFGVSLKAVQELADEVDRLKRLLAEQERR